MGKGSRGEKKKPLVLPIRLVNNSTTREAVAPRARASPSALRPVSLQTQGWAEPQAAPLPGARAAWLGPRSAPPAKPKLHLWLISLSCHQSYNCALLGKITKLATWHITFVILSYLKSNAHLNTRAQLNKSFKNAGRGVAGEGPRRARGPAWAPCWPEVPRGDPGLCRRGWAAAVPAQLSSKPAAHSMA